MLGCSLVKGFGINSFKIVKMQLLKPVVVLEFYKPRYVAVPVF